MSISFFGLKELQIQKHGDELNFLKVGYNAMVKFQAFF